MSTNIQCQLLNATCIDDSCSVKTLHSVTACLQAVKKAGVIHRKIKEISLKAVILYAQKRDLDYQNAIREKQHAIYNMTRAFNSLAIATSNCVKARLTKKNEEISYWEAVVVNDANKPPALSWEDVMKLHVVYKEAAIDKENAEYALAYAREKFAIANGAERTARFIIQMAIAKKEEILKQKEIAEINEAIAMCKYVAALNAYNEISMAHKTTTIKDLLGPL